MPTMNRLEFTKIAIEELFKWTDGSLVEEFLVVDGHSEDGTAEWLRKVLKEAPFPSKMVTIGERHVVSAMLVAHNHLKNDLIVKVDSDTVVCPQWLDISLQVMRENPNLWALGVHGRGFMGKTGPRKWQAARHVGGIGVFRRQAWNGLKPRGNTYFGWTGHQQQASWKRGWLNPGLPIFVLNLLRFDPYLALSDEYIRKGWQRKSRLYYEHESKLWNWKFPNWKAGLR